MPRFRCVCLLSVISAVAWFCSGSSGSAAEILIQETLFKAGDNGYHTYRIPALLVAGDGSVLALCEARKNNRKDHGDIDLVMKRSEDGGRTWSEMMILVDAGEKTAGNPCPVLDGETGTVWLPYCIDNDTVHMLHSDDHGQTWSESVDITADVKAAEWGQHTWYATGPTHGIQLASGRLVIPCDHREGKDKHSHVFYSDDHGKSWKLGGTLDKDTDECGVVELSDGRMLINMRSYRGKKQRTIAYSSDGGETWGPVTDEPQLVEPVCQGSILRLTSKDGDGRGRILFSNPPHPRRENVSVRLSYDDCQTWPVAKRLFSGPSAYSDLAATDDGMIFCLYERGHETSYDTITFARFNLEWLTDSKDTLP